LLRLASSFLLATTVTAAALVPGAAVFASPASQDGCPTLDRAELPTVVESSDLILIGVARETDPGSGISHIEPEAFLKGSATDGSVNPSNLGCGPAGVQEGDRLLLFLTVQDGVPDGVSNFRLADGRVFGNRGEIALSESELVAGLRDLTGQYLVPAHSEGEGEGIEWTTTVLPIAVALGIVFVIGLFLMRIWHRIDPS
jgi:hypothetical protein